MLKKLKAYVTGKNLYSIFLHLVVVMLAIEVVILARQNKELKRRATSAQQESLKAGDYFSLSGMVPLASNEGLDSTSTRQVIFVFTTRCPFCKETLPFWKRIADQAKETRNVALIGISLDEKAPTKAYLEDEKVTFPVFVSQDKESFAKMNKLRGVPQTIIRTTTGHVEEIWKGRLSEKQFHEVARAISDSTTIQHQ